MLGFLLMLGCLWLIAGIVRPIVYGVIGRRRRRRIGRGFYGPSMDDAREWGRGRVAAWTHGGPPGMMARREQELDGQQATIDALETKVADLEARLDFAERLLAGRPTKPQA